MITALEGALKADPGSAALRLHLAQLLLDAGRAQESLRHAGLVLEGDPANSDAVALAARAAAALGGDVSAPPVPAQAPDPPPAADDDEAEVVQLHAIPGGADAEFDVERPTVTLADVGGMADVKKRLDVAFLAPMRNPKLRRYYGKSLRGGLLLYGPPGCGKTFIARALAGELGAKFQAVGLSDVLDMWLGESERKLHEVFQTARRNAPCVLFLDEVDALGQKRSHLRHSAGRSVVNQLLAELDGAGGDNEGVFILAATNHPWDVDTALRRPGRLDRMLLVLPPDREARAAIVATHLRNRPVDGIDPDKVARTSDGYTGADLAQVCESAAELALMDSLDSDEPRPIRQRDLERALREVQPSGSSWFQVAYNYAMFANDGGAYDELLGYIRSRGLV